MTQRTRDDDTGQGLVEYALLAVLVVVASVLAMSALGVSVQAVYGQIIDACCRDVCRQVMYCRLPGIC